MLHVDDAGIVSHSSEGLERMTVIVTACSAFGLTVSEAKTDIMWLQTEEGQKVSSTINAAGQVYKQTIEFRVLGRGHHRRQTTQYRYNEASSEGMGVLPAVHDGNL